MFSLEIQLKYFWRAKLSSYVKTGGTECTTRNQAQIVCVIKCNEFSQVKLATYLNHPFITEWILIP